MDTTRILEVVGCAGVRARAGRALGSVACRVFGAAVGLAMIAAPAAAQAQDLLPPQNKDGIEGRAWISGLVLLMLIAMVQFAAFMKTKRGHQD